MIGAPPYNRTYETSYVAEFKPNYITDIPERYRENKSHAIKLAGPIRAIHPRMRPTSPDYSVLPRVVRADPGLGVGFGINWPDVTKIQPPKDIIQRPPRHKIGTHPQTAMRYPNNFLHRLYEDDGEPPRYEYGYVPRSRREMVDILAHHKSFSTTTRDMTEEGKLPLEPRPQPTTTLELETDRAADRWKRFNPRPEEWQKVGPLWDRAQQRQMVGRNLKMFEPRALSRDRILSSRPMPEMNPAFQIIRNLVEADRLPYAFKKPMLNYGGHVPRQCVDAILEPSKPQPDNFLSVTQERFNELPSSEYQEPKFPLDGRFTKVNALWRDPFSHGRERTDIRIPPSTFYKYF